MSRGSHDEKEYERGVLQLGNHVVKSWAKTQNIIALSSGEAELYATNLAAAQAMGLRSLLEDLGIKMDIRLFADSSTSKAITNRTGLGKLRHVHTNELWLQQRVKETDLCHLKIKNIFKPADLMPKPQDAQTIRSHMETMDHKHEDGRSIVAPNLNAVYDIGAADYFFCMLGMS